MLDATFMIFKQDDLKCKKCKYAGLNSKIVPCKLPKHLMCHLVPTTYTTNNVVSTCEVVLPVQIDLSLDVTCKGEVHEYVLSGVVLCEIKKHHYSSIHMDYYTGAWISMDDDNYFNFSSFPCMNPRHHYE